jgi:hypothetical protein
MTVFARPAGPRAQCQNGHRAKVLSIHNHLSRQSRNLLESLSSHTLSQILQLSNEPNYKSRTAYHRLEHLHQILWVFTIILAPYLLLKYEAMDLVPLLQPRQCMLDTARERHLLPHTDTMATDLEYRLPLHLSNTHITPERRPQIHNSTSAPLHHLPLRPIELHMPRTALAPSMHTTVVIVAIVHLHLVLHHLELQD